LRRRKSFCFAILSKVTGPVFLRASSLCPNAPMTAVRSCRPLILFAESLRVGFPVRIEKFLAALLPSSFEFRCCDVPIRPAFFCGGAQVLTEFVEGWQPEVPIAVIDLVNDETRLEDDHMGDHGIVKRVGIFCDVEIFLDNAPHIREEGPVGTDSTAIF